MQLRIHGSFYWDLVHDALRILRDFNRFLITVHAIFEIVVSLDQEVAFEVANSLVKSCKVFPLRSSTLSIVALQKKHSLVLSRWRSMQVRHVWWLHGLNVAAIGNA